MDFTIYTFGDVEVFRAALAGMATIFNANGFLISDGGLGLGALAAVGLLIGLTVTLVNGIVSQKVDLGGFVMVAIAFAILFVPKFHVNVEDYNGDAIATVVDVPLGVALPAGMVSGLAREMNKKMGEAFSTLPGYPASLMASEALGSSGQDSSALTTPEGLRLPLKMLLSLRKAVDVMPEREPVLLSNIGNIVAYCLAGREHNSATFMSARVADDPVAAVMQSAADARGLTIYTNPATGVGGLVTCSQAAGEVMDAIDDFFDSSRATGVLTAAAALNSAAPMRITASVLQVVPVTSEMQMDNLAMLFQVSPDSGDNFIKSALFMPGIARAFQCADGSGDPRDWAQCTPFQTAVLQSQEDEVVNGTSFQRVMFSGMNGLFFIWICLAPIVAMLMLMMGMRGLKLVGSYLLFGAWTVSWYVGASIVNFYMLKQLQYELTMLGTLDGLTPATMGFFFDVLSNKFAMAGTMMGSVPLIMFSVMSGTAYGMAQLAGRMGGRDDYDDKSSNPTGGGGGSMMQMPAKRSFPISGVDKTQRFVEDMPLDGPTTARMSGLAACRAYDPD